MGAVAFSHLRARNVDLANAQAKSDDSADAELGPPLYYSLSGDRKLRSLLKARRHSSVLGPLVSRAPYNLNTAAMSTTAVLLLG